MNSLSLSLEDCIWVTVLLCYIGSVQEPTFIKLLQRKHTEANTHTIHTHTLSLTHTYRHTHKRTGVLVYIYTHSHTYAHTHTRARTHIRTHTHAYTRTHARTHTRARACTGVLMYTHTYRSTRSSCRHEPPVTLAPSERPLCLSSELLQKNRSELYIESTR